MPKTLGCVPSDGYTEHGYIREIPGLSPAVRFKFRPSSHEEIANFQHVQRTSKHPQNVVAAAKFVGSKIVEWDLTDANDEPLPKTTRSVLSLKEVLYDRLLAIITGMDSSDVEPGANPTDAEKEQSIAELLEAEESGKSVAEVRQANDEKN